MSRPCACQPRGFVQVHGTLRPRRLELRCTALTLACQPAVTKSSRSTRHVCTFPRHSCWGSQLGHGAASGPCLPGTPRQSRCRHARARSLARSLLSIAICRAIMHTPRRAHELDKTRAAALGGVPKRGRNHESLQVLRFTSRSGQTCSSRGTPSASTVR